MIIEETILRDADQISEALGVGGGSLVWGARETLLEGAPVNDLERVCTEVVRIL